MQHEVAVRHEVAHQPRVADVAEPQVDGVADLGGHLVEPAVGPLAGVEAERPDVGAQLDQPLDEMAADEAIGPGHEDPAARERRHHAVSPPSTASA